MGWARCRAGRVHRADRRPCFARTRLRARSPVLAGSVAERRDRFYAELREWAAARAPGGHELRSALQVNVARAAAMTAYERWDPDAPFSDFVAAMRDCLAQAAAGLGPDHPEGDA